MMVSALYAGYPQDAFATVNEVQAVMQSNPVKGQVVDENGDPVIGATVMMKGTSKGAITDLNGNFTLENAAKGTLVISYIGYITEEVQTNGQASVKVVLKEDAKRLDEVVVIGYGTQRKEELTSSVMSVKASEFVQATKPDVAAVVSPDANPLSTSQVSLRGVATLNSGTFPLVIIDGVQGDLNSVSPLPLLVVISITPLVPLVP